MPSLTTSKEATILRLQSVADSCGLHISYQNHFIPSPPCPREFTESSRCKSDRIVQAKCEPIKTKAGPDIEWQPSYETYRKRVQRLAEHARGRPHFVPEGFPDKVDAPRVWTGSDFRSADEYVVELTVEDIAEAENALAYFKGT